MRVFFFFEKNMKIFELLTVETTKILPHFPTHKTNLKSTFPLILKFLLITILDDGAPNNTSAVPHPAANPNSKASKTSWTRGKYTFSFRVKFNFEFSELFFRTIFNIKFLELIFFCSYQLNFDQFFLDWDMRDFWTIPESLTTPKTVSF